MADFKNDYARTFVQHPPDYDMEGMAAVFAGLEEEGRDWLREEGVTAGSHELSRSADLRYAHQGSELTIPYHHSQVDRQGLEALVEEFHRRHQQLYGFALDQPVEIVTLRVTAAGQVGQVKMPPIQGMGRTPDDAILERRQVYFEESDGFVPCAIYNRSGLYPGAKIYGPAILEGMDATVVINPGWEAQIDQYGNCIMRAR